MDSRWRRILSPPWRRLASTPNLAAARDVHRSRSNRRDIFTRFYESNHWGDAETRSGPGSTLAYTENIRRELPGLWIRLGTRTILDAPCGDFNWFREIRRPPGTRYIGADIVKEIVAANRSRHANRFTRFVHLDIVSDPMPCADFWLCRDCLFHLSNAEIFASLRNFLSSDIPYLCTSTHPHCHENADIPSGAFRQINLERPPFDLPPAAAYIDDWLPGYPFRRLALWDRQAVAAAAARWSP